MTTRLLSALLVLAGLLLNACQAAPAGPTALPATPTRPVLDDPSPLVVSERPRNMAPAVDAEEVAQVVEGNSRFGLDLYHALPADGNLMFSPYSIFQALAMTYAGARGSTESQMAAALHYTLPQADLHPALNALDLALLRPPEATQGEETPFQLNIANSIWGQRGYAFLPDFLDVLAENYGAGLRVTDFATEPEPSRERINQWVSEQTQEKINDLIPPGAVSPNTRLVLANAIYFKAEWMFQFEPGLTQEADFNLIDGSPVTASMMRLPGPASLLYAAGDGYQAVALPYRGGKASMLLLVPDPGRFAAYRDSLSADLLAQVVAEMTPRQVMLAMPGFSFESEIGLVEPLAALGMTDAFTPGTADFSGMDGTRELFISAVLHKAFVAVDEAGTEAAAATAVIVGVTSLPALDVELTVDRPFIFLIRDEETGAVLFVGQVLDPRG